jgi:uncharacterized protein YegJ (DUF2314 family)
MRQSIFIISFVILTSSCDSSKMGKTEREGEPNIYSTPSDDKEMNEVISKAKNTLDQFDKALLSNKFDTSTFALKVKFPTETGAEHIWATNIKIENTSYYGIVDNLPNTTTQVKLGERIKLNKNDITDWMYSDNGTLSGGYTIKLIRNRMTEDERKKFDKEFPFKIDN